MLNNDSADLLELATTSKYLNSQNSTVKRAVEQVVLSVQAVAKQALTSIERSREQISDMTDHLDGILSSALKISQAVEIAEIAKIGDELSDYFDASLQKKGFKDDEALKTITFEPPAETLRDRQADLEARETELKRREKQLEKTISARVADAEKQLVKDKLSSKKLLESALQNADMVFDQNKIIRFAYATVSQMQREFKTGRKVCDIDHITKMFHKTINPIHKKPTTNTIRRSTGNTLSDSCYQDLFIFFFRYYNELMEIYEEKGEIPSSEDEQNRLFKSKQKNAQDIIFNMRRNNE